MTPYFNTPEKLTALLAASLRWLGTPFRENSRVPGPRGGVSCHMLVASLYIETGALPPFDIPRGSARRLLHNPADTITAYLDQHFPDRFAKISDFGLRIADLAAEGGDTARSARPINAPQSGVDSGPQAPNSAIRIPQSAIQHVLPGDLLILCEGRIGKHVAIALPGERPEHGLQLIHVLLYSGCQISQLNDPTYATALLELRRPIQQTT